MEVVPSSFIGLGFTSISISLIVLRVLKPALSRGVT
jgi:hypothetical protein